MTSNVFRLITLSVVCGALISVLPEGGTKRISQTLYTVMLIFYLLSFFKDLEFNENLWQDYASSEVKASFAENLEEKESSLEISIIEQRCNEYILDKAADNQILVSALKVKIERLLDTQPLPYSVEIYGTWDEAAKKKMASQIKAELGIPEERQHWNYEQ